MGLGLLAPLLLSAVGAGLQEKAAIDTRHNMNDAVGAELARQQQYGQKGQALFNKSLSTSSAPAAAQQIARGQQQALGSIQNAQSVPLSASMPTFGAQNTAIQAARQGMSNQGAANYFGYQNLPLQYQLGNMNTNALMGMNNDFARQSLGVLPTELQAAQGSEANMNALGSLLGTGGLLWGLGSATRSPFSLGANNAPKPAYSSMSGIGF